LSWPVSPSSDVTHYVIELRNLDEGAKAWKVGADKVEGTTCVVDGLNNGDEFYFRVIACNEDVCSEPSHVSGKILIEGK